METLLTALTLGGTLLYAQSDGIGKAMTRSGAMFPVS